MSWTDLLVVKQVPASATVVADVSCHGCGYNLRGATYGGRCPECGRPVRDSLTTLDNPTTVARGLRALAKSSLAPLVLLFGCFGVYGQILGIILIPFLNLYRVFAVIELRNHTALPQLDTVGGLFSSLTKSSITTLSVAVLSTLGVVAVFFLQILGTVPTVFWIIPVTSWAVFELTTQLIAGRLGHRLAAHLDWPSIRREFVGQFCGAIAGLLVTVIGLPLLLSNNAQVAGVSVIVFAAVLLSASCGFAFSGLHHLANAAEQESSNLEEHLDLSTPDVTPSAPSTPTAMASEPDIQLEQHAD